MAQVVFAFHALWWEWLVWAAEILLIFGMLVFMEFLDRRKEFRKATIWKSFIAALCIIIFVVVTGWVGSFFIFDNNQDLFPLSIILAFALTIALIHKWLKPKNFYLALGITTLILLIVYIIRVFANVSLYLA